MEKSSIIKRLSFIAFVMVVLAAWVAPGYSVDVNWDAQYRVRTIFVDNARTFNDDASADRDSWIDQRFRLGIRLTEAPVSGYVQLQMGDPAGVNGSYTWGTAAFPNAQPSVFVRQAYLDFPVGPVGLRAGRTYASHGFLGGGLFENIADRIIVSYKISDELSGSFIHPKVREGSGAGIDQTTGTNDSDRNAYNLGVTWKPAGRSYDAAARIYYNRDAAQAFNAAGTTGATVPGNWDAFWLAAQSNVKLNPVNIYVSAAFLTGSSEPTVGNDIDLTGYAAHIDANIAPGPFKVGLVAGIGSGDDDASDDSLDTFFAPGGASYIQSHIYFQSGENNYSQSFINTANLNLQNGSNSTLSNTTWAGLYGDYMATPDLTLGARIATFMKTDELTRNAAGAAVKTDDSIGNEIDLTLNYMIHKNLSLLAFAAWFMPDDGITGGGAATDDNVAAYYARLQWEIK